MHCRVNLPPAPQGTDLRSKWSPCLEALSCHPRWCHLHHLEWSVLCHPHPQTLLAQAHTPWVLPLLRLDQDWKKRRHHLKVLTGPIGFSNKNGDKNCQFSWRKFCFSEENYVSELQIQDFKWAGLYQNTWHILKRLGKYILVAPGIEYIPGIYKFTRKLFTLDMPVIYPGQ